MLVVRTAYVTGPAFLKAYIKYLQAVNSDLLSLYILYYQSTILPLAVINGCVFKIDPILGTLLKPSMLN